MARLSLRHTSIVVAAMASVPGGSYTSRTLQYKVTLSSALINTPFEHAICCQKGVSVPDFAVINGTIGEAYYDGQAQNHQLLQQSTDIDNYNIKTLPVVEHGQVIALLDIEKCVYDAIASMEQAAEKGKAIAAAAVEGVEKHWGSSVSGSKEIFDHVPVICPITLAYLTHIGFVLGRRDPPQRPPCRSCARRPVEQERKKGVPWNKEEHKLFLLRLKKYGKGEWRNISRNFVVTRIPTQVASHAQKYFIRQLSGGKDKRRASIHRITSVNIQENHTSPGYKRPTPPGLICSSLLKQDRIDHASSPAGRASFHPASPSAHFTTFREKSSGKRRRRLSDGTLFPNCNMVGRKDGANKQEHVTRESALRKEFEDREAAINKQREVDRREWQDSLWEFEKIMLGRSPYPLLPGIPINS
ncbi:transcription factor DIVARICATA [Tanacetum coccineum]